jgi:hypothetical protein
MQTLDFFQAFSDYSIANGFSFYFEDQQFKHQETATNGNQMLVKIAIGAALGLVNPALGILAVPNSGFYQKSNSDTFTEDIKKLKSHCDLVGIKDALGSCYVTMTLAADEIPDEAIIGRTTIIHGLTEQLKKYSLTILKSRFGEAKSGVMSSVFLVFSSHKRAKSFFEEHASKCQHRNKTVNLFPYVVDLEDKEIKYSGGSFFGFSYWGKQAEKMSNKQNF